MKQPSTAVSLHYYQQAVKFTVNVTKSPYKAVTFYVCYILRETIYSVPRLYSLVTPPLETTGDIHIHQPVEATPSSWTPNWTIEVRK